MAIKHSIFLPTGFGGELGGLDPVAAYEFLLALVKAADEEGLETAWVLDHFQTVPESQAPLFECWTLVASFLRETQRLRIGQLVTANGYRNPALQAKMASTADVIGNGRLTFGIGAGWYEADYVSYGYAFDDTPTRLRQLREAVQIIRSLWTEDVTTFDGEYYNVHNAMLIAGAGEKVTLKLVAQYGDLCNIIESPAGLERKYAILRDHCEAVGRDYDEIRRTSVSLCILADTDEEARAMVPDGAGALFPSDVRDYGLIGTPDTIRARLARYEEAGVQELAINFIAQDPVALIRRYASEFMVEAKV
jgi:alkanesulfonate monooxygenase SsuD/methylene tetrahydromethanopterin reductase-like flavin-dependent oxidoreductase (luciferase family)